MAVTVEQLWSGLYMYICTDAICFLNPVLRINSRNGLRYSPGEWVPGVCVIICTRDVSRFQRASRALLDGTPRLAYPPWWKVVVERIVSFCTLGLWGRISTHRHERVINHPRCSCSSLRVYLVPLVYRALLSEMYRSFLFVYTSLKRGADSCFVEGALLAFPPPISPHTGADGN